MPSHRFFNVLLAAAMAQVVSACVWVHERREWSPVEVLAGARVAYLTVRDRYRPYGLSHPGARRVVDRGSYRIDLETFETTLVPHFRFWDGAVADHTGREYYTGYHSGSRRTKDYREALWVMELDGRERILGPEPTLNGLGRVALAVEDGATWVFHTEYPPRGTAGREAVVRVQAETEEMQRLPIPTEFEGNAIWLSAQSPRVVYLTWSVRSADDEDERSYRTRRGDFESMTWGDPIEGSFRVVDTEGTLLSRREHRPPGHDPKTRDPTVEVIRNGVRTTVDIGAWFEDDPDPLFGTGYVMLWDHERNQIVMRSLFGGPDHWLPENPPVYWGKPDFPISQTSDEDD